MTVQGNVNHVKSRNNFRFYRTFTHVVDFSISTRSPAAWRHGCHSIREGLLDSKVACSWLISATNDPLGWLASCGSLQAIALREIARGYDGEVCRSEFEKRARLLYTCKHETASPPTEWCSAVAFNSPSTYSTITTPTIARECGLCRAFGLELGFSDSRTRRTADLYTLYNE